MDGRIAVLPGDGIGPEVIEAAVEVLEAVARRWGHRFHLETGFLGGCAYDRFGTPLPEETLELCRRSDAVLFGASGGPKWDHLTGEDRPERALARLRKEFDLFVNLRPIRARRCLAPVLPVKERIIGEGLDFLILRELTGGVYYGQPRGIVLERGQRRGFDTMSYTEEEVRRIVREAFRLAQRRRKKVTSIDKMNMLESSRLWYDVAREVAAEFPDVELDHLLVDAAAMVIVQNPARFDVIVTTNIFGDILSDEAAVLVGSLGMLPSASYGSERFGLYEPVHGTAPDIAGKGVANPIAAILSVALMLRHTFGLEREAQAVEAAVDAVLEAGFRTPDIRQEGCQTVGTRAMTQAILEALSDQAN
ncbi:MAG: 3-isopropylmalate dehydrogenase [Candidatus Poribacteria bacterium]|nr:MAG: 3-isopropylmalate dehydrogenase [Candidatus Poribacteria bacterium]